MHASLTRSGIQEAVARRHDEAGPVPERPQPDCGRTARAQRLRLAARGHAARTDGQRKPLRDAGWHRERRRDVDGAGGRLQPTDAGIQQSLDMGADGVLVPYINTADEARAAVSCCRYPTAGTRSVYFPQRSMNKGGLLGYAGAANDNVIVALQVETADCIRNIDEIAAVPGVDMLFLGQNDLCMSMGLYEKYKFPDMYTSPELARPRDKLIAAAQEAQHHPRHLPVRHGARRRIPRTRDFGSSASATISITSSPRPEPT